MAKTTKKTRNPVQTRSKFYFSHKTLPFRFAIITIPHSLQCFRRGRPAEAPSPSNPFSPLGVASPHPPPPKTPNPPSGRGPTPRRSSRTAPSNSVIARSEATWQSVRLLRRTSDLCVGVGFYPRPICRTLPVISCRAAPMCAAADNRRIPIPCVGGGVPDAPFHRTPKNVIAHP